MEKTKEGVAKGVKQLIVYQRAMELVLMIYKLTKLLPTDERFGLVSQMRRASVSIVSNIAEGYIKSSKKEKAYYLETAFASLLELEAQVDICLGLEYLEGKQNDSIVMKCREVGFLLHRYISKIKT